MTFKKIIPLLLTCMLLMSSMPAKISQNNSPEYSLKAAFLYRFTDYVEWANNNSDLFTVGVLGESPITYFLNEIARNKMIKKKPMIIKQCDGLNEAGSCQVLFVPKNSTIPIETILSWIGNKQVLIITEQPGFATKGAHINFLTKEKKLRFEVNLKSVAISGLKISSQLLQHAIIVEQ